eukprot:6516738-Karenia_brevis.AAC.1
MCIRDRERGEREERERERELPVITRTTTMTHQEGNIEYLMENAEEMAYAWKRSRPWCGQTVFTFEI